MSKRTRGGSRLLNASMGVQLGYLLRAFMVSLRDRQTSLPVWVNGRSVLLPEAKKLIADGKWRTATPFRSDDALMNHLQSYIGAEIEAGNTDWDRRWNNGKREYIYKGM